ncbi:substrate-binding domain-containing protein [Shimia sp. R10_1]|uniref:substrate-binding domain-containing protein n=1 Tax=Shimia sp. R10_1 TaxID=2821095 RepID=UPI001AD9FB3E|nr:substrate-binding domain-containing protein [Shimia sp. R10_1]MBO9474003.1 substrate-binding domain-containing protein [Shimia sp. R10_1]
MKLKTALKSAVFAVAATMSIASTSALAEELRFMTTLPTAREPFFVYMQQALNAAGEEHEITIIEADGEGDSNVQSAHIERAITLEVDGIIISPIDVNALAPAIEEAIQEGIPVVTIDRRVDGVDGILAHIGADNVEGGRAQGRWVKENFPDGARILYLRGRPGSSPAIDRNKGLHEELDGDDKYVFAAEQTANWLRDEAFRVTETIMAGLDPEDYPTVVVSASDAMGFGALEAVDQFGLRNSLPHITFDAAPNTLQAVKAGTAEGGFSATVDQWPGLQAATAVEVLKAFVTTGATPDTQIQLINPKPIDQSNITEAERYSEIAQ